MKLFLLIFIFFFSVFDVQARYFDMRAISRSRGFRSNEIQQPPAPVYRPVQRQVVKEKTASENESTDEFKLKQTGKRMFQSKDEHKVLNFNVKNPEFDRLDESDKKDILNRISIQEIVGG